tara:strand:- start:1670 stop:4057 length:2388 start_codon:yes stop_codon:yes gene_type:complete
MAQDIRVALTLDNKQFNKALAQSEKEVNQFSSNSTSALKGLGAAFAALGTTELIKGIVETGSAFQDLNNSLNIVFGSVQQGEAQFARIQQFAATTQFSVQTLTQAFIQLKGAGVEPTDALLKTFADTSSVVTDQLGAFQAMLDLVSRSTAGGLGLEDLNRLADRGIPVFAILQQKLGITRLEISEFGKTAEGAATIIDNLVEGLDTRFGGALSSSEQNISRLTNNLGDAFDSLQNSLFKLFSDELAAAIDSITKAIESLTRAIDGLEQSGETLKKWAIALGSVLLFLINPIGGIIRGLGALSTRVLATGGFFRGMGEIIRQLTTNFKNFFGVVLSKAKDFFGFGKGVVANSKALQGMSAAASLLFKRVTQLGSAILGAIGINALFSDSVEDIEEAVNDLNDSFVGPPIPPEVIEQQKEAADALAKRIQELTALAKSFTTNDYRTELEKLTDAQKEAEEAIYNLIVAQSLANGNLENYEELMEAARNQLRVTTEALNEFNEELANENLSDYQKFMNTLVQQTVDYVKEQEHARTALAFFNQLFEDGRLTLEAYTFIVEKLNNILGETVGATKEQTEAFDQFKASVDLLWNSESNLAMMQENLNNLFAAGKITAEQLADGIDYLNERALEDEGLNNFLDTLGKAQKALSEDLADAFIEGESAGEAFQNFFKKMIKQIIADIIRLSIIQPILSSIMAPFGFGFGSGGSVIKLPGLANGGPAQANKPYIVGEEGPELFVPKTSGTVVPNGMGGTQNVTNNYITNSIQAVDAKSVAQLFAENRKTLLGTVQMAQQELPYG